MSHEAPDMALWTGRDRKSIDETLIHHVISPVDLDNLAEAIGKSIVLMGFCCDEGVQRNQGRPGAIDGPNAIRKALCNLAVHWLPKDLQIFDSGNVLCLDRDLEGAQETLQQEVQLLFSKGYFPLLIGGGHEISYPHFTGVNSGDTSLGIINLDAHFDLRPYENGPHSGSWARQIMDENEAKDRRFNYLPIGINPAVNNREMFGLMQRKNQDIILVDELKNGVTREIESRINAFVDRMDQVSLTLDLDVISAGHAPGVSAPASFGLSPEHTWQLIQLIMMSGKVRSMDIAELNPAVDDGRTAKLAGHIIHRILTLVSQSA